jgi:hypothetical protein
MRIKAYLLAADPTWIEASVLSYYSIVSEIVVSYDSKHMGWTGAPIPVSDCLKRLREIDREGKLRFVGGDYARPGGDPMEGETHQRQQALEEAGRDTDWVLQLDTDEVLPNPATLIATLREAERRGLEAVEWPMRVLFRHLPDGRFLEVCARGGADRFEYPGPVAVRPGVRLLHARRADTRFIRAVALGDRSSLQIQGKPEKDEIRLECVPPTHAIVHNSWGRSPGSIRSKIESWGHSAGLRSWLFYYLRWRPCTRIWRLMRDFHPFARGLWPALKPYELPFEVAHAD